MGASRLAVSTVFFLSLTLSSSRAVKSSCIQWRKPGESVKISCSPTSKEDHLYLYKFCESFPVLQWDLKDTFTIKAGWEPRVKTEVTETKGLIITIANLTAEDTGYYNCQYKVLKDFNLVVTSGAGSVLLVVHVVLCVVILLLLSVLVTMWILRTVKSMHINAVRPVQRAHPSDVYEDMRSTCRR
ncbi:uncharacterized protein LOC115535356 isoform X2 [Gadus morhua]|uniref:uncharacterized protein LOC115535356 isoform X2 n=1 Tax=Gadus morhua TaxID=8049 RepID=UPI0011B5A561|nr:uncharacterized protein LOC115535356 isoform X2 [Gadus morhua]